jgi:hypothetical protein
VLEYWKALFMEEWSRIKVRFSGTCKFLVLIQFPIPPNFLFTGISSGTTGI